MNLYIFKIQVKLPTSVLCHMFWWGREEKKEMIETVKDYLWAIEW